eukprot:1023463-Rhodomonas_salina.4
MLTAALCARYGRSAARRIAVQRTAQACAIAMLDSARQDRALHFAAYAMSAPPAASHTCSSMQYASTAHRIAGA